MPRTPRVITAAITTALITTGGAVALSAPAGAATPTRAVGVIGSHFQYRGGTIDLSGWVFDRNHPRRTIRACVAVDGTCVRTVSPHQPSRRFDRRHHIVGAHKFHIYLRRRRAGALITLKTLPGHRVLDRRHALTPGRRVVSVARKFVGGRYTYGGSSPRTGFDCSGYSMYSYEHGRVASLPHNANAQRFAPHMHGIRRSHARPGDLIFYFSGGSAYHVAIFAGHGYQYSASDPRDGIQYQPIHSSNIRFATNWH